MNKELIKSLRAGLARAIGEIERLEADVANLKHERDEFRKALAWHQKNHWGRPISSGKPNAEFTIEETNQPE